MVYIHIYIYIQNIHRFKTHIWNFCQRMKHFLSKSIMYYFRFDGFDSDNTYLLISDDKLHLQCLSTNPSNSHLCGRQALNLPARNQFTPELLFKGALFRPRDGSYHQNKPERNRYTWNATHYRVMGRMAECAWLGEYEEQVLVQYKDSILPT